MKNLKEKLSKLSVLVFGDIFLDKDSIGIYDGISQEKDDLSIFKIIEEKYSPGGGGNLAACFSALGVNTNVIGLCGDDINGQILENVLLKSGINRIRMIINGSTLVFGKFYLEDGKHIFRYDIINGNINDKIEQKLIKKIKEFLPDVDMIACADYNDTNKQGICSEKILNFISKQITPKFATGRNDVSKFKNFTCLLLNDQEYYKLDRHNSTADLVSDMNLDELVITTKDGATSVNSEFFEQTVNIDTLKDNIDTCGCGDMFYAMYVSCKMAGYNTKDSLRFANCAARIVVTKKFGANQATINDIINSLK